MDISEEIRTTGYLSEKTVVEELNKLVEKQDEYIKNQYWVGAITFDQIKRLLELYEEAKEKNEEMRSMLDGKILKINFLNKNDYIEKKEVFQKLEEIKNEIETYENNLI